MIKTVQGGFVGGKVKSQEMHKLKVVSFGYIHNGVTTNSCWLSIEEKMGEEEREGHSVFFHSFCLVFFSRVSSNVVMAVGLSGHVPSLRAQVIRKLANCVCEWPH